MTQAEVAGHFHVSDVTIHRWENGKAPVTVENFIILARIFGADTPGALMFHPDQQQIATSLRETADILVQLETADRDAWLDLGRRLASGRAAGSAKDAAA